MEIGRQIHLLYPIRKALHEIAATLEWLTGSKMWQLDSNTAKVTWLSPGLGNLANKRAKPQTVHSTVDIPV